MNKIQLLDPGRIYVYTISCIHVQYRCGFLQTEIKVLLQSLEEMDIPDPADGTNDRNVTLLCACMFTSQKGS